MKSSISAILDSGFNGLKIDIECHMSNGLPNIIIVGFANKAVDEAKERIRSAFASSNIILPKKRITINLAPADVPKESTSLDVGMAVSILHRGGIIKILPDNTLFIGELGLDGSIRPVRGVIGKLIAAKKHKLTKVILPSKNMDQASLVAGIDIYPVKNLEELRNLLDKPLAPPTTLPKSPLNDSRKAPAAVSLQDIVGQPFAKRALEIAAAGNHNVLLNGPPGTGKSMLAKALISILPDPTTEEMLEITHLHSLAVNNFDSVVSKRPFRSPHHSSSDTAIMGGGKNPRPGEISLAHRGVLLFDEFPEFRRSALEGLRQPLEDATVNISRAKESVDYPADFLFIATANPCPCGFFGSNKTCACLPAQITKYQKKLSGPIIDRIDIFAEVSQTPHEQLLRDTSLEQSSADIRKRVTKARQAQQARYGSSKVTNSTINNAQIKKYAQLTTNSKNLLDGAADKLQLSSRGYMKTIKVARTIADLDGSSEIQTKHLAEALQYRKKPLMML